MNKVIVLGLVFISLISCKKDFEVSDQANDVTIKSIPLYFYGDCYTFETDNKPYLLTEKGSVYEINEASNSLDLIRDIYFSYEIIGPIEEMNNEMYLATERTIYKIQTSFIYPSAVYAPSTSYGEIISFKVIDDIAFVFYENGGLYANSDGFSTAPTYLFNLPGAQIIKIDNKYFIYSEDKIYMSSDGSSWSFITSAPSVATLSGKSSSYGNEIKFTGIVGDGNGKLLVSYAYNDMIFTDLLDDSFQTTINKTASGTYFNEPYGSNQFIMGNSILLDAGAFFNFSNVLYSSSSSYYTHPGYYFHSSSNACAASLSINNDNTKTVTNSTILGCISPLKFNNKIYSYNIKNRELVIISK
jgi:hypothetical protein